MTTVRVESRRPVAARFERGALRELVTGKPLVELKLDEVIASRDTQGVRINGVWFVPAAPAETYLLARLWKEAQP